MALQPTWPASGPGEAYLQQLASLREEMASAMLAISGDSISVLEESLWRQQVLCVSLKRLLQQVQNAKVDSECMNRIRAATVALHRVNQTYAELITQVRSQSEVMYGLCLSYTTDSPHETPGRNGRLCSFEA